MKRSPSPKSHVRFGPTIIWRIAQNDHFKGPTVLGGAEIHLALCFFPQSMCVQSGRSAEPESTLCYSDMKVSIPRQMQQAGTMLKPCSFTIVCFRCTECCFWGLCPLQKSKFVGKHPHMSANHDHLKHPTWRNPVTGLELRRPHVQPSKPPKTTLSQRWTWGLQNRGKPWESDRPPPKVITF